MHVTANTISLAAKEAMNVFEKVCRRLLQVIVAIIVVFKTMETATDVAPTINRWTSVKVVV